MNQILVKWWQFPQWNILFQPNQIWKYYFIMRKSVLDIFSSIVPMDQLFVSKILWKILTYKRLGKISSPIFLPQETHLVSSCAGLTISILHWKVPWVNLSCFIYYDLATAELSESVLQLPDVEHVIFIRFNLFYLTCVIQTGIICAMNVNIQATII